MNMAQKAPDNLGNPDDHKIIELGDEDFVTDPGENREDHSVVRQFPERKPIQSGSNYRNFININPSIEGWVIKLDLGESKDEETMQDIKTLETWRNIGVFNIKFKKVGKKLLAVITNSEDFEEDQFGPLHMALFGKKQYHIMASAPLECLRHEKTKPKVEKERMAVRAKTRATLNEDIGKKANRLESMSFKSFTVYISTPRLNKVMPKLTTVADLEGLTYQQLEFGSRIRKIIFRKGPNAGERMIDRKNAIYLAAFNPDIE